MVQDDESVESTEKSSTAGSASSASATAAATHTAPSEGRRPERSRGERGQSGPPEGGAGGRRYSQLSERSRCRFTRAGVERIDYKDIGTLQKLITPQGKIQSRKRTGTAARYQRMVKQAVKRARFMALLPYTG